MHTLATIPRSLHSSLALIEMGNTIFQDWPEWPEQHAARCRSRPELVFGRLRIATQSKKEALSGQRLVACAS